MPLANAILLKDGGIATRNGGIVITDAQGRADCCCGPAPPVGCFCFDNQGRVTAVLPAGCCIPAGQPGSLAGSPLCNCASIVAPPGPGCCDGNRIAYLNPLLPYTVELTTGGGTTAHACVFCGNQWRVVESMNSQANLTKVRPAVVGCRSWSASYSFPPHTHEGNSGQVLAATCGSLVGVSDSDLENGIVMAANWSGGASETYFGQGIGGTRFTGYNVAINQAGFGFTAQPAGLPDTNTASGSVTRTADIVTGITATGTLTNYLSDSLTCGRYTSISASGSFTGTLSGPVLFCQPQTIEAAQAMLRTTPLPGVSAGISAPKPPCPGCKDRILIA